MAHISAVVSAKGGVGKSSLCAGLSRALAIRGRRVLLIDTDIGLRSADILLGVSQSAVYGWDDVLNGCPPEKACIKAANGVTLLCAPFVPAQYDSQSFRTMVLGLQADYDYIMLDSPAGFSGGFELCAACAQAGIVVATPDEVSLRAASIAADKMRQYGVTGLRLVVNRFVKRRGANTLDHYVDGTSVRLLGAVPEDKAVLRGSNGAPVAVTTPAFAAYGRIAGRLEGENIPLEL